MRNGDDLIRTTEQNIVVANDVSAAHCMQTKLVLIAGLANLAAVVYLVVSVVGCIVDFICNH